MLRIERGQRPVVRHAQRVSHSPTEQMVLIRERDGIEEKRDEKLDLLVEIFPQDTLQRRILMLNHNLIKKGRTNRTGAISRAFDITEEEVRRLQQEGQAVIRSYLDPKPK